MTRCLGARYALPTPKAGLVPTTLSYLLEPADAPLEPALLQVGSDLGGDAQPRLGVVGDIAHEGEGLVGLQGRKIMWWEDRAALLSGMASSHGATCPPPSSPTKGQGSSSPLSHGPHGPGGPCRVGLRGEDRGLGLCTLTFRMTLSTSVPTGAYRILGLLVIRCTRRPRFRCSLLVKPSELMLPCLSASGSIVLQRGLRLPTAPQRQRPALQGAPTPSRERIPHRFRCQHHAASTGSFPQPWHKHAVQHRSPTGSFRGDHGPWLLAEAA